MTDCEKKLFSSKQEIMDYSGITKHIWPTFIELGLPVLYIGGRCYAHKDNIDEFFRRLTRTTAKGIPPDIINSD